MLQRSTDTLENLARRAAVLRAELSRRSFANYSDIPPVYVPFLQPARYKGAYGGRGSAKSHFFARLLIGQAMQQSIRAVCVREHQISLEESVKRLLEDKIKFHGLEDQFRILNSAIEGPNDSLFIFRGMKDYTADSIKSLEGFNRAWVEEAQTLSARSLKLLRPTIRVEGSEIWFSWNPRHEDDPIDQFLRGPNVPSDAIVIRSTYKDNPYLPSTLLAEAEYDKGRDLENYEHVWGGEYETHSEARVFKNFKEEAFETPDDVALYYGADWGFSADPSVLIRVWFKPGVAPARGTLFIDYEAWGMGVEIDHLGAMFKQVPGSTEWPIVADSARPETISFMRRHGFPKMESAIKGKDSVKEGIIFLQGYDIVVHPRCKHAIQELKRYSYKKDPLTGKVTPVLEDKENHVIDSIRYAVERVRKPKEWYVA